MHRRQLLQVSAATVATLLSSQGVSAHAAQTPVASPASLPPEDAPLDARARKVIGRLFELSPVAVLDALLTSDVSEPLLVDAASDGTPTARSWHDTSDADLEHALGGVLIITNDASTSSPELELLGNYIVFESAEIAYDQLMRQIHELQASGMSDTIAGAKVWIVDEGDILLGFMRLGNVFVIGDMTPGPDVMEGMVMHLDTVTRAMV